MDLENRNYLKGLKDFFCNFPYIFCITQTSTLFDYYFYAFKCMNIGIGTKCVSIRESKQFIYVMVCSILQILKTN